METAASLCNENLKNFANCTSDNRYPEENVFFIPFVKPHINEVRCRKWIHASRRVDLPKEKINKYTYVCSKHFIGGKGPTEENPDPVPATISKIPAARKKRLSTSQKRSKSQQNAEPQPSIEEHINQRWVGKKIVKSYPQHQQEYQKSYKIPKTNAQRQRQFRENQKRIQLSESLILARKQKDAERAKRYRDKLKLKKQSAKLDSLLSPLPTVLNENKKETDHRHDANCEELVFSQCQMQPSMNYKPQQAKLKRQEKIANETDEQKRQRLERVRLAVARYRENESLEQRSERLLRDRIRTQQSRRNKPPAVNELREQHLARLERKRNLRQAQATKYNITDTSPTYDSKEELALCHRPENGYRTYRSARSRDTSQIVTTATTEASELGVLDPLQNLAPVPDAAIEDIKLNDHQEDDLSQILELAKKIAETVSKPNNTNRSFVEYVYTRLESMDPEESKAKIIQIADILEF